MTEMKDAFSRILQQVDRAIDGCARRHITLPLHQARGYAAAQDRHATQPFPPFPASTMDGYAVIASDGVGTFDIVGSVTAGRSSNVPLQKGQVIYITTGAPVPDGADAVVPIEWTEAGENDKRVKIVTGVSAGTNIRPIGSDIAVGQTLIHAGQLIGAAEIAILAGIGQSSLTVVDKPTVGVLSTGDEIVEFATEELTYGQIRDSNRPMMLSLIEEHGGKALDLGIVKDVVGELEKQLLHALEKVDMLVLSGGVSMGSLDLLKPLLAKHGTIHFGRLNMKPGKPTTFATIEFGPNAESQKTKLIFGLPGNPVSSLVTGQLLLVPAIKAWRFGIEGLSSDNFGFPTLSVRTLSDLSPDAQRPEFHRVHVSYNSSTKEWQAVSTGSQMSSRLLSVCGANGLIIVPKGNTKIQQGTFVQAIMVAEFHMPAVGPIRPTLNSAASSPSSHASPHSAHRAPLHSHPSLSSNSSASPSPLNSTPSPSSSLTPSSSSSVAGLPPTAPVAATFELRVAVLTVSDRCSAGLAADLSGPAIHQLLLNTNFRGCILAPSASAHSSALVPDEIAAIQAKIKEWTSKEKQALDQHPHLILTTGGTGFSPRDITPEAISPLLEKHASGLVHLMMSVSLAATPMGALSRPVAGSIGRTLILTLPGSPKAIPEILGPTLNILPHACKLLQARDDPHVSPNK